MLIAKVPKEIDIDALLIGIKGNQTKINYLRNGLIYLISLLHYRHTVSESWNYVHLNTAILEKIIGKGDGGRVRLIKRILLQADIIDTSPYLKQIKSSGFRLKWKYLSDDLIEYPLGERISDVINNYNDLSVEYSEQLIEKQHDCYTHLSAKFRTHKISWKNEALSDLKTACHEILQGLSRRRSLKPYLIISLLNYCGFLLKSIYELNENIMDFGFSKTNNRMHSVLTSIPKSLRPYLQIDEKDIVEIDTKTAQVYFLSTIMTDSFFFLEEHGGFNLAYIYPELKQVINAKSRFIPSFPNNYILGCELSDSEILCMNDFQNMDFTADFYCELSRYSRTIGKEISREKVKKQIMTLLFDKVKAHRNKSLLIGIFSKRFPGVNKLIEDFQSKYSARMLALLLQRVEAFLILEKVSKEIILSNPEAPIFTIHDSILTTPEFESTVFTLMKQSVEQVTGKPVGLKSSLLKSSMEQLKTSIMEKSKLKNVKRAQTKIKSYFKSRIYRGYDFLFPNGNNDVMQIIDDISNRYTK